MEPEMKIRDHSPWHHLIFVEELADDISDKANCKLCREQVVGAVYKCLECDFIQHKSCPNPTQRYMEKMSELHSHFYGSRHHLMLVEEVENRAEAEVVCCGCQEIAFLPAFKCASPGCSFLLHKSCAELSSLAVLHPQHSDHVLTLQPIHPQHSGHVLTLQPMHPLMAAREEVKSCNACSKRIKYLYYGCRHCNIYLHPTCFAPERKLELEPPPAPQDRSPWHHLIFVEELADDISEKAYCKMCWKKAVGPVYKCLECDFIQHKSCPNSTQRDWEERMKYNPYQCQQRKHHLMLVEEVENRAEEEVVCWGCEEIASLPAYKCALPGCTFLLHESCAELPLAVLPLLHSDHVLILQIKEERCNACIKAKKSLYYGCESCEVYLHQKCLPLFQISSPAFHEHRVIIQGMPDRFLCEACGEETMGFPYICNICHRILDKKCCDFSETMRSTLHGPHLTFTDSVRLIDKQDKVFCRNCRKQVNTRYGAYYCENCGFLLHVKCARRYEDKDATFDSEPSDCNEYAIYLVEGLKIEGAERVVGPQKIQHFNHPQHELILSHKDPGYDKQCEACMRFIFFPPFYGCAQCVFFLHSRCAALPISIKRGLFHEHQLRLVPQAPSREKLIYCGWCGSSRDGFAYKCDQCVSEYDVQCSLIPEALQHPLHQHTLFFVGRDEAVEGNCNGCGRGPDYICVYDCEFKSCIGCATLPHVVKYRYHLHPLTLTNVCDNSEEYYCFICEEKRDPKVWFYWCKECDFTVHSKCILSSNFKSGHYESKDHQHPLTFVQRTEDCPPCNACDKPFKKWSEWGGLQAVECSRCKFFIHRQCQTKMFTK